MRVLGPDTRDDLPGDFTRIIGLIEAEQIDTQPWITHRVPFCEIADVFPTLLEPGSGVLKAVVEMPASAP